MATRNHYGVILAGGRGTRFWPRSRRRSPKQLLSFLNTRSLLWNTVERLQPLVPPERIWVLTSDELRRQVMRELPEVPGRQVVAEPAARNTGPCIALAAQILAGLDPDAVLGIFPADHHVERPSRLRRVVRAAFKEAEKGSLVVVGINPRWPETGYGYVEFPKDATPGSLAPVPVLRFREKPDQSTAQEYVAARRFYWNSGMFFWRADVFLDAFRRHLPKTASLLARLPRFGARTFPRQLAELYPCAESISVDYAVLEKAAGVMGLAAEEFGWNDLGSWRAVYELLAAKPGANVTRTDALLIASQGAYVDAPGKLAVLLGCDNLVVVDTPDALLIADRARAQQVGDVVRVLEKLKRDDLL